MTAMDYQTKVQQFLILRDWKPVYLSPGPLLLSENGQHIICGPHYTVMLREIAAEYVVTGEYNSQEYPPQCVSFEICRVEKAIAKVVCAKILEYSGEDVRLCGNLSIHDFLLNIEPNQFIEVRKIETFPDVGEKKEHLSVKFTMITRMPVC